MRRILLVFACVVSLFTLGSGAPNAAPDFTALYRGYEDAVRQMNVDGYMAYFGDELRVESAGGETMTKPELISAQQEVASMVRVQGFHSQVESVTPLPEGEYAVIVRHEFDRDQSLAPGAKLSLQSSVVRREIWRQTSSGWKIVGIEDLVESPTAVRLKAWL